MDKAEREKYGLLIPAILIWIGMISLNGCVDMQSARYYNPILYIANGVMQYFTIIQLSSQATENKSKVHSI